MHHPRLHPFSMVMGLALGLLTACGGETETAPPSETPTAATAPTPVVPTPLDPATLDPTLREVGAVGTSPRRIHIEFAQRVVDDSDLGKAPAEGTRLRLEPAVEGQWSYTSASVLSFEPTVGFSPGTRYTVELEALALRQGVLEPPSPGQWERVFETPDFDFVRLSLAAVSFPQSRAELELAFSGAVAASEVQRKAELYVADPAEGSRTRQRVRFEQGSAPHTVLATLESDAVRAGTRLELSLEQGVPSLLDPGYTTDSARASVPLEKGPEARILNTHPAEGTNGYYVQVICDDTSVQTRHYHWDRVNYDSYQVSTRCLPDEADAQAGIHFEPPVDFSIAPSGGGFRIFGDFQRGPHRLRIDAGVRTADGGMVHKAYEKSFDIAARSPKLNFVSKGRYLPRSAWRSLPVRHLNTSGATLRVRHVPSENLVYWMSAESENATERTSNLILEKRISLQSPPDLETTSYVDVGSLVSEEIQGLLQVEMVSGEARATSRILLTDLHLIAKRTASAPGAAKANTQGGTSSGPRAVHAWAVDMESTNPQRGVEIQLVRKSGYVVSSCVTGTDGGCRLDPEPHSVDPSQPFALIARRGTDLTYLAFDELRAEIQEARISGEPYSTVADGSDAASAAKYRAAIYSDRGVYRPGETAHLAAIVRGADNRAPGAGMPVEARLVDPLGQTLRTVQRTTNGAGYVDLDVDFPDFSTTGRYQARLAVADTVIGQYTFQVEDFVPERMEVDVAGRESAFHLDEAMHLDVGARYLFGGVPANHRLELHCELVPGVFEPPQNSEFHYGVWRSEDTPQRPLDLGTLTTELDATGTGTFTCPGSAGGGRGPTFRGPATLMAKAAVFEAGGGRTTVGRAQVPVHPDHAYIGLKSGATQVEAGNTVVVEGLTVDWQGRPTDDLGQVQLEFVRLEVEYGWYYDETLGHETYRRFLRPVVESRQEVDVVDGRFNVQWTPESHGAAFLVRASAGNARTELHFEGQGDWYYWGPEESESQRTPRPGRATWLALRTPESARVGEPFPVNFTVPYGGRVLLTAETDELLYSEWMKVDAGDAVWFLELDDFVPNVYVTAFLVKDPHLDSAEAFLPDRAFGVRSVRLEPSDYLVPLELDAPDQVRSNETLTVELDLSQGPAGRRVDDGPVYATVAAVDEGILSLTGFDSPDPAADIFSRRALGVETFETVGWTLLVPPGGPSSTTGGDLGASLGRVQPIKPVALWSGLVEVPDSGRLSLDFQVPQYRGELRIMAVAAGPQRLGRAEASVTVRDPLMLQATLPRFLAKDDRIDVPVMVTNLSGERRDITVELSAEDLPVPGLSTGADAATPVEIQGAPSQQLSLAHGAADTVVFSVRARQATGAARLVASARAGNLESRESSDVPLLPTGPKSRRVTRQTVESGTTELAPMLTGWLPLSERSTVWVTHNPYGDVFDHLKYLIRYPYGCIEQTTSSTRPLLHLADQVDRVVPKDGDGPVDIEDMVQHGLDRLFAMQTPSGGFAYWPGGLQPTHWGTAYATHLLLDAQKLGYAVPQHRIDESLAWMERQITNTYETGDEPRFGRRAEPYLHFVLAMADRGQKGRIERLLAEFPSRPDHWQTEQRFMLQAALHRAGDHRYANTLKSLELSPVSDRRINDWTFFSDRRQRGFMLSTLVDLFGRDSAFEPLANLVADALRGESRGYTTQELVWGITGLGKFIESGDRDFEPPTLLANGRPLEAHVAVQGEAPKGERLWHVARASEYERLTLEIPEGDSERPIYLVLSSEGVRETPEWRTGGEGLRLTRKHFDAGGRPVDLRRPMKLGDLVYTELTLRNTTGERVANIALVDRIPAGWEIENPRLGRGGATEWMDPALLWQADHMNVRDDRLEIFGALEPNQEKRVFYAVRAVTAGRFTVPTVEAEAMYDPRIWARERQQSVTVIGPWTPEGDTASGMP